MNTKTVPFTAEQLENIIAQYPTPFHIYDEEGIVENMKAFINAFSWNKGFKQYFAVKATPNPYIMRVLQKLGVGADCSSLAELMLCEKVGITGHDIMFTSNDTPYVEYKKALELGAIINLDDITHIEYLEKNHGSLPDTFCVRYNPGSLKEGGNTIIGLPEEAKYGMTREQILEAYKQLQAKGVKHFGIHTMVVSNELDIDGLVGTAELCFNLAVDIKNELGINVEFISCMANLMRPALYGSYHHITVMGKENAPKDHVYDVTGSLCENNDKFAIQRELPKIDIGDRIIIHDAGAHGHSMGFNYNGKLRSAELLLHKDGSVTQIRRAETYDDLFGTLDFSNL